VRVQYLVALGLVAVLATGCGGKAGSGGTAHSAQGAGAKVFTSARCGDCHSLAAAHTSGQIGPDLDQLKPAYDAVVAQVTGGGNGMPSFAARLSKPQIAAVASYVVAATKNSTAATLDFKPDKKTVASCGEDYACYKQAFGNVAFYDGPRRALSELAGTMKTNSMVEGGCHQIAHAIGHAAYARYHHDAAKALANGSMTCWSGYYHGVIERAFGGVPRAKVVARARSLCAGQELKSSTFLLYQCVHGLGHGLMIYSRNDLFFSLRVCDGLATAWDKSSCTGGVFMQNFLPGPMQVAPTKWLSAKNLIYPCNVVAERDKLYCYLMVTSRILPEVDYNWTVAVRWCRRSEPTWVATCFQSLGRDASGFTVQHPAQIVSICKKAGDMERECIYGAARDLTANDAGPRRGTKLCLLSPLWMRAYCFEGVGTILGGFVNPSAGRKAECDAGVPPRWRADCYRGANV
jgi:mono/diheme cytochrome c family protein